MTQPHRDELPGFEPPAKEPSPFLSEANQPVGLPTPPSLPEASASPPPAAPAPREKVIERPHPLTGIANAWIALVAVIAFGGREFLEGGLTFDWSGATLAIAAVVLGVALISVIGGVITWRTTTFVVDDDEFRIERNLISRQSTRIDFTKVQAVDIHRPLAARLLGLAAVQIDVGGSGGKSLKYLSMERAEQLRDHLLSRMGGRTQISRPQPGLVRPDDSLDDSLTNPGKSANGPFSALDTEESAIGRFSGEGPGFGEVGGKVPGAVGGVPAWVEPPRTVVAVKPVTLLLGVIVSNMVWYILISSVVGVVGLATGTLGVYGFGFLLGAAGLLWKEVAGNWGFVLTQTPDGLHVSRGLTSRSSQSVRQDRIQGVLIQHDFLQRLTGLFRVRVTVLGLGDEEGSSTDVMLPYGTWPEVLRVLHAIWPDVDLTTITPHPQPKRAKWLTPLSFSQHTWGTSDEVIVADDGWLSHSRQIVPHRRMQSIGISQGPLQRRLRLASVEIHTTDGPISLKAYHLDEADARRLFDEQNLRGRRARAESQAG